MRKIRLTAVIALVTLGLVLPIHMAFAGGSVFYSPTSTSFVYKLTQWSAQGWQHVLSLPAAGNPLFEDKNWAQPLTCDKSKEGV